MTVDSSADQPGMSPIGMFVRAVVGESGDVDAFDDWYETHHMPIAGAVFQAPSVRFWSIDEPRVHYALYGFASLERMEQRLGSVESKAFSTDFDQSCPTEATRARETLRFAQSIPAVSTSEGRSPEGLAGPFVGELPRRGTGVLLCWADLSGSDDAEAFEDWYEAHHLPLAAGRFQARAARFWNVEKPTRHYTLYEFASLKEMDARLGSADYEYLINDFDQTCPISVARGRERLRTVQSLARPT